MSEARVAALASPAGGPRPSELLAARQRLVLILAATTVTLLAWTALALIATPPGPRFGADIALLPHTGPHGLAGFGAIAAMWLVMMIAMMLPAVMPWLMMFATMAQGTWRGRYAAVAEFTSGYFAIWLGYSLFAAALQVIMQRNAAAGTDLRVSSAIGGAMLLAAGAFQLSSLKESCLAHCRSPLSFFLARWDDGPRGPFRMGFRHGLYCLGCCWALMALSFALGVMNLLWMAALTLVICVEKLAPGGNRWSRVFAAAFAAWGTILLIAG